MISVEHVTKRYGTFTAVQDLSFEIEEGHVYGFLGPNGAGKSTTMNIMTGCLSPSEGHVKIDGYDILEQPNQAKKLLGYLPEQPPLYPNETPAEYLRFVGQAKGLKGGELSRQIDEVIAQTKLEGMRNRCISALSKGYKQRVGIAQALLGHPKVIILDEPTVGLDPIQIIEIRDLIQQLGREHTVVLSSHILSEVQAICDQILIISNGRLVAFDRPENLEKQLLSGNQVTVTAQAAQEEAEQILGAMPHLTSWSTQPGAPGYVVIQAGTDLPNLYDLSRQLFFAFAEAGKPLVEMSLKRANLEEIFLQLTEQDTPAAQAPDASAAAQVPETAEEEEAHQP